MAIVKFKNVSRIYTSGDHELKALDNVNLSLAGEYEMTMVLGWKTYVISVALTFGMSLLVSFLVAGKNKKINMAEALKCAE